MNNNIAKRFMKKNSWRNDYIICEGSKTNIDINYENLNPFNEEEVLILPFTEFKVKYIYTENQFNKKIYTIKLIELGNKNIINYDNMKVESISDSAISFAVEQFLSKIKYPKDNN